MLEPALDEGHAFLAVSCGFALASKSLSSSDILGSRFTKREPGHGCC